MTLKKQLEKAAERLEEAAARLQGASEEPVTLDSLAVRIDALTEYALALADIQAFNNESIHEKLQDLASRMARAAQPAGEP
jgi:hypothetical protein